MSTDFQNTALHILERIASALENNDSNNKCKPNFDENSIFVWNGNHQELIPAPSHSKNSLGLLVGLEDHCATLIQNTKQFAQGFSANNALLWGARGMGKSSLVKAIHSELCIDHPLILIEILREDLGTLHAILSLLAQNKDKRFILFCDDLSFDEQDHSYKSLKAILEGGVQGRPENVLLYATSNRRHLMPRDMIENEKRTAIHHGEAVEEKVSLSDRFGLWLGFYPCSQKQYFEMVTRYAKHFGILIKQEELQAQALEWSMTRGARSGRVAWQFIQHLAGLHEVKIEP